MRDKLLIFFATVALSAAFAGGLWGQTPTGTIQGIVQDASNAAVPNARITITNAATNEVKELRSDSTGRYVQPFLLAGFYTVAAEKEGFRPVKRENIKLDVGQNRSVDFSLEVGALAQELRVEAGPLPLDVNTSSIGQVIENKRIMDLPLNGRSAFSLANLTPGVNPTGGGATPSMGGGRNGTSDLQIDGVTDVRAENNPGNTERIYEPQVDAIQEFSIQVNALSAEYGHFGGGVINVATKSGANSVHGTAYDFLRNSKLDANSFFANTAGRPKGSFKRNQWGGTLGGPIFIPEVYDGRNKSFFFVGFEGTNSRSQSLYTGTVPITEWRSGDFSNLRTSSGAAITIYDPLTVREDPANPGKYIRSPFAGNRIPSDRLDPVAVNLMKYFPPPNVTAVNPFTNLNNYANSGTAPSNSYRVDTRVDQNWTPQWRMFARVSVGWSNGLPFNPLGSVASSGNVNNSGQRSVSLDHTITVNPTLLVNLRYGLGRYTSLAVPLSNGFDLSTLGFPKIVNEIASRNGNQFPSVDFGGAVSSLGPGGWNRNRNAGMIHSLSGSVTKILSRHTIKAGGEYRKSLLNVFNPGYPSGTFSFSSGWTQQEISTFSTTAGFPLASALLGLVASGRMSHDPVPAVASAYFAGYFQDDFKLTRRLTLNIGLRYDLDRPRTERYNQMSAFALYEPSPIAGKVPASACVYCGNLLGAMHFMDANNRRQTPTDTNNFGPRIGFAYDLGWRTAIRGGYGIAYPPSVMQATGSSGNTGLDGFRTYTNQIPTVDSMRSVHSYLRDPFVDGYNLPSTAQGAATFLGDSVNESVHDAWVNSYVQQWNLNIQHEVRGNMVVEIGYLGNRGVRLTDGDGGRSYSQLPASYMKYGSDLLRVVPNSFYGIITSPTSVLSQPTVEWRRLQRPYPQYSSVGSYRKPYADSIYHGMTIRVDKRFSKGLSFLMAYTAGKLIDDASNAVLFLGPVANTRLDAYNRHLERAVSSQDVAQRAVFSYVYELPFGKGRRLLSDLPKALNMAVSGWQVNGITTLQSGLPLIVTANTNNTNIFTNSQRPNNDGRKARITGGSTASRIRQWLDTSVFSQPPAYTFGNTGRTLPDARTPGLNSTDLSIFKNNYFGPEGKLNLQYRVEMFGAFNTPQFGAPGGQVGTAGFGVISSAGGSRVIQMALKLNW